LSSGALEAVSKSRYAWDHSERLSDVHGG